MRDSIGFHVPEFKTVVVHSEESRTWHQAMQNQDTGTILSPEGCNLDDAQRLEMYPDLPEWVKGVDLCKRCYSTSTDR